MPRKLAAYDEALREQVKAKPDATLTELQAWLKATHAVTASDGLICRTLAKLGLTLKKSRSRPPNRTVRMLPRPAASGANNSQR